MTNLKTNFREIIALSILLIFSLCFRLYHLKADNIYFDEAYSIKIANQNCLRDVVNVLKEHLYPPFWFFLTYFWLNITGENLWLLPLPGIIFSLLSIYFIFKILKEEINFEVAFLVGFSISVSLIDIHAAKEIRHGASLLIFTSVLSFYFITKILKNPKFLWTNAVGYLVTSVISLYTHYVAFFLITTQFLIVLVLDTKRFLKWLLCFVIITILFLPWLYIFIEQRKDVVEQATYINILKLDWIELAIKYWFKDSYPIFFSLVFLIVTVLIWGFIYLVRNNKKFGMIVLFWILFNLLLMCINFYLIKTHYIRLRYIVYIIPALNILICCFCFIIKNKYFKIITATILITCQIFSVLYWYSKRTRQEYEKISDYIIKNASENELCVVYDLSLPSIDFYTKNKLKLCWVIENNFDTNYFIKLYKKYVLHFDSEDSFVNFLRVNRIDRIILLANNIKNCKIVNEFDVIKFEEFGNITNRETVFFLKRGHK